MRYVVLLAMLAALAGCYSLPSGSVQTDVVSVGNGLYMVSGMDYESWSAGVVKSKLYKGATEFCAKSDKKAVSTVSKSTDAIAYSNYASAEIQFRCE